MSTDIWVRIPGSRGKRFRSGGTPYQITDKVCPLVFAVRSLIYRFVGNSDVLSFDASSRNRRLQSARRFRRKHNFDFAGGTVLQFQLFCMGWAMAQRWIIGVVALSSNSSRKPSESRSQPMSNSLRPAVKIGRSLTMRS